jgi:hypothetical protein
MYPDIIIRDVRHAAVTPLPESRRTLRKLLTIFTLLLVCWAAPAPCRGGTTAAQKRKRPAQTTRTDKAACPKNYYIQLLVRISDDSALEVIKAAKVEGRLNPRELLTSDYVYEVVAGGETLVTETLAADPFAIRGFPSPKESAAPDVHKSSGGNTAILTINLPCASLDKIKAKDAVWRLYKVEGGASVT